MTSSKILAAGALAQGHCVEPDDIIPVIAAHFGVNLRDLRSQKRHRSVARPRMIAMYLVRGLTSSSFPEIGHLFGGRDHTTVISAVRKIEHRALRDPFLFQTLQELQFKLKRR